MTVNGERLMEMYHMNSTDGITTIGNSSTSSIDIYGDNDLKVTCTNTETEIFGDLLAAVEVDKITGQRELIQFQLGTSTGFLGLANEAVSFCA